MQLRNLTVKVTEDLAHLAVRHITQLKAVKPVCTGGAVNICMGILKSPALFAESGMAVCHCPGNNNEASMPYHLMVRTDCQPVCFPCSFNRLCDLRFSPRTGAAEPFRQPADLCNSCHIADQHTARRDDTVCLFQAVPRIQHIKDDTVVIIFRKAGTAYIETAHSHLPP